MSEHTYWAAVRELIESGHAQGAPKRKISAAIVDLVQSAHADGERWATETLARWEVASANRDYTRVFKDMNAVTYIRADGRRVRKTVAYSRPKRSTVSGEIIGRQMQSWWGMSRAAVEELRREMFAQGERIDDVVAALDQVIAAMERHPDCTTALEAWEADGHIVSEIDLGEATGT